MLPIGVHVELADTSAPQRSLLKAIETVNARLLAGWRNAAWRHCSPLYGGRFVGGLPSAEWRVIPAAGGVNVAPGDLSVDPDITIHNTLPLYVGDRVLAVRLRLSSVAGNVVTVQLERAYAGDPDSDNVVASLPAADTLVDVPSVVIPRQTGSLRTPIDILIDVTTAIGAPATVREWDMIRAKTIAFGTAPGSQAAIEFHALSVLVDHPV